MKRIFALILVYMLCLVGCTLRNSDVGEPIHTNEIVSEPTVEEKEKWDYPPMVMIDGVIYLDTGHNNNDLLRCGSFDGEITSTVEGWEMPTADDQSNFGTGYGYQYGSIEGTVEIFMYDRWRTFATEEVRERISFPIVAE